MTVGVPVSVHNKFGTDIFTGFRTGGDESLKSGLLWNTCCGWTFALRYLCVATVTTGLNGTAGGQKL